MQADNDKDGRLTLTEMIDNPYVFYSAVFNDDEDEYDYHDEFRWSHTRLEQLFPCPDILVAVFSTCLTSSDF